MPCVFINTHNPNPLKKDEYKYFYVTENEGKLNLIGVRKYYYDHPDAPGLIYLTIDESEYILRDVEIDTPEYSMLYLLKHQQNACKILIKT